MDKNEVTMLMDVKLDLKERREEFYQLRTWTRCNVKVEAIKCFPCYIKITFLKPTNAEDDQEAELCSGGGYTERNQLVVKINIPGLSIQLASSRTKQYTYGLFWTNNRKRCCIYLALDSHISCERHMQWFRKSVKNLELHRKEILETRRASRISSQLDDSKSVTSPESLQTNAYQNNTQNIKDLKDILGPLPDIPDSYINWSRRISGFSGIYEEIVDGSELANNDLEKRNSGRKLSRASVASGIYEVMRPPLENISETIISPPPLPPRTRILTQSGVDFHRSFTNPETASFKKRKKNLFETVFLRHKRTISCGSDGTSKSNGSSTTSISTGKQSTPTLANIENKFTSNLVENKRNSFSSPDLTKGYNPYSPIDDDDDYNEDLLRCEDVMSSSVVEFSELNSSFLNSTNKDSSLESIDDDKNISQNILSTFNISCNESTVNLVGSNLNDARPTRLIDDLSGYCKMMPIFDIKKFDKEDCIEDLPVINYPSLKQEKPIEIDTAKSITFRRNYDDLPELNSFENLSIKNEIAKSEVIYSQIDFSSPKKDEQRDSHQESMNSSIDEKYPSYFPNTLKSPPIKLRKSSPHRKGFKNDRKTNHKHLTNINVVRTENVYISSPTKKTIENSLEPTVDSAQKQLSPKNITIEKPINLDPAVQTTNTTPRLYNKKYATLSRFTSNASPNLYPSTNFESLSAEKSSGKMLEIGSSIKRFASLPRFRKIDFSPLKIKINNVLQRHNSDDF